MAEIDVEKRTAVWPWFLAAIIVVALIWLLIKAFDVKVDPAAVPADGLAAPTPSTSAEPAAGGNAPAAAAAPATGAATAAASNPERYAGMYASSAMRLALDGNGTYSMREGQAGEGRGSWSHDAGANALRLVPDDGSQTRHFRVESNDMLMPLDSNGEPVAQVAQLARQAAP